jgi:hypothetical protein
MTREPMKNAPGLSHKGRKNETVKITKRPTFPQNVFCRRCFSHAESTFYGGQQHLTKKMRFAQKLNKNDEVLPYYKYVIPRFAVISSNSRIKENESSTHPPNLHEYAQRIAKRKEYAYKNAKS